MTYLIPGPIGALTPMLFRDRALYRGATATPSGTAIIFAKATANYGALTGSETIALSRGATNATVTLPSGGMAAVMAAINTQLGTAIGKPTEMAYDAGGGIMGLASEDSVEVHSTSYTDALFAKVGLPIMKRDVSTAAYAARKIEEFSIFSGMRSDNASDTLFTIPAGANRVTIIVEQMLASDGDTITVCPVWVSGSSTDPSPVGAIGGMADVQCLDFTPSIYGQITLSPAAWWILPSSIVTAPAQFTIPLKRPEVATGMRVAIIGSSLPIKTPAVVRVWVQASYSTDSV